MQNFNLEVELRKLRLDCEIGGYTYEMTTNSTYNNKRFLLDVRQLLANSMRYIDHLLGSEEVTDEQVGSHLWDKEVEEQLTELRHIKFSQRCEECECDYDE